MREPREQFMLGCLVAALICVGVMAVWIVVERREFFRSQAAIVKAESAYCDATAARESAEAAVEEYAEVAFPRELADINDEIKKAEDEILDEHVNKAEGELKLEQDLRLLKFRRLLRRDRMTAILNLRAFGAGVSWLLGRWKRLESAFNTSQCWNGLRPLREALLLRGPDDDQFDVPEFLR